MAKATSSLDDDDLFSLVVDEPGKLSMRPLPRPSGPINEGEREILRLLKEVEDRYYKLPQINVSPFAPPLNVNLALTLALRAIEVIVMARPTEAALRDEAKDGSQS